MPDDARWAANKWQFVATMGLAELLGGNPHYTTTDDHISPLINDATCAHIGMFASQTIEVAMTFGSERIAACAGTGSRAIRVTESGPTMRSMERVDAVGAFD